VRCRCVPAGPVRAVPPLRPNRLLRAHTLRARTPLSPMQRR
jgi:hypothetical protein